MKTSHAHSTAEAALSLHDPLDIPTPELTAARRARRARLLALVQARIITYGQLGKRWGVTRQTARKLVTRDSGPPSTKLAALPPNLRKELEQ